MRLSTSALMAALVAVAVFGMDDPARSESHGEIARRSPVPVLSWSPAPSPWPAASPWPSPSASPWPIASTPAQEPISLGQAFDLELMQSAVVNDEMTVRFSAVTEDSRCPTNVECVWEGNAQVIVEATLTGHAPTILWLNTNPGFETEAAYHAYTIKLFSLAPYPRSDVLVADPYRATLVVQ